MMYFFLFLIGACLGSFINAWVWRIHEGLPIGNARSQCTVCSAKLMWYDNIPVVSYICLRGKCRRCDTSIGMHYPMVEAIMALVFCLVGYVHHVTLLGMTPELIRDLGIVFFLTCIFQYDARYGEILDRFTLIPAGVLFIAAWFLHWQTWQSMLWGVAIGAGFFLIQFVLSRGRWIGGGDIRLGAFMGVILGFPNILMGLFFSYIIGSFGGLYLLLRKQKTLNDATPFGTYLAVGTFIAMVWGSRVIEWYLHLLR